MSEPRNSASSSHSKSQRGSSASYSSTIFTGSVATLSASADVGFASDVTDLSDTQLIQQYLEIMDSNSTLQAEIAVYQKFMALHSDMSAPATSITSLSAIPEQLPPENEAVDSSAGITTAPEAKGRRSTSSTYRKISTGLRSSREATRRGGSQRLMLSLPQKLDITYTMIEKVTEQKADAEEVNNKEMRILLSKRDAVYQGMKSLNREKDFYAKMVSEECKTERQHFVKTMLKFFFQAIKSKENQREKWKIQNNKLRSERRMKRILAEKSKQPKLTDIEREQLELDIVNARDLCANNERESVIVKSKVAKKMTELLKIKKLISDETKLSQHLHKDSSNIRGQVDKTAQKLQSLDLTGQEKQRLLHRRYTAPDPREYMKLLQLNQRLEIEKENKERRLQIMKMKTKTWVK